MQFTGSALRRTATMGVLSVIFAGAGLAASVGPASAGTNGQQIKFHDRLHRANSVWVGGYNQHGNYAEHCWKTPTADTNFSNWWWKGNVSVIEYANTNCTGTVRGSQTAYIPVRQSSNWVTVSN
ncbi:hypothetical protein [Embleya sp. MST-111070]|uniref:hypothetical protein n=1 Tax=Embleya sp. MST-111070 TaxID=3398231 RepID=UPI003F7412EB